MVAQEFQQSNEFDQLWGAIPSNSSQFAPAWQYLEQSENIYIYWEGPVVMSRVMPNKASCYKTLLRS